ncbi:MAG: hypothetical protein U0931_07260 [Vulcanimicrobiota bacterium]
MRRTLVIGLLAAAPALAQPPSGPPPSVRWSQVAPNGFPTAQPDPRAEKRRQKQQEDWRRAQEDLHRPQAPPPAPKKAERPEGLFNGFSIGTFVLTAAACSVLAVIAFVRRNSAMTTNFYAPHRADPGPIDHEQTRKFISRPSPAPLDLGLSGHSSDDHDDYGSSSDDNGGWGWSD